LKLTYLETPVFTDQITRLLADADYRRLQEYLLGAPTAGDLIIGTGGCRKIRWATTGRVRWQAGRSTRHLLLSSQRERGIVFAGV